MSGYRIRFIQLHFNNQIDALEKIYSENLLQNARIKHLYN